MPDVTRPAVPSRKEGRACEHAFHLLVSSPPPFGIYCGWGQAGDHTYNTTHMQPWQPPRVMFLSASGVRATTGSGSNKTLDGGNNARNRVAGMRPWQREDRIKIWHSGSILGDFALSSPRSTSAAHLLDPSSTLDLPTVNEHRKQSRPWVCAAFANFRRCLRACLKISPHRVRSSRAGH